MTVDILYPEEDYTFTYSIDAALNIIDQPYEETIIIGWHSAYNKYKPLGILFDGPNQLRFYEIKMEEQLLYRKILEGKINKTFQLRSSLCNGIWTKEYFKKIELEPILAMISACDENPYRLCRKAGKGFMVPEVVFGQDVIWKERSIKLN